MIAQKVADKLGVKLKIVNTEFPSLISELKNDKVDLVLSGMTKTAKREKVVDFSKPYYTVENVMLVQRRMLTSITRSAIRRASKSVLSNQRRKKTSLKSK